MNWINERYTDGRLVVQYAGIDTVNFIDAETSESVTVMLADSFLDVQFGCNGRTFTLNDGQCYVKGKGIAQRDVWHIITRDLSTALRVGLTRHRSAFSSTPHPFELNSEPGFEEVFLLRLPNGGKGLLEGAGYLPDGKPIDKAWPIRDMDAAQVPMGWHRVVALPDADGRTPELWYIWCYLCLRPEWEKD